MQAIGLQGAKEQYKNSVMSFRKTISRTLSVLMLMCLASGQMQAQNSVEATATTVTVGQVWTLTVSLTNTTQYATFQADIALPEGVTLKDGSLTPSSRLTNHTVTATTLADGTVRVVAYNATNTTLTGTSGELFTLTLTASPELVDGNAKATFRNLRFTDASQQEVVLDGFYVPLETSIPTAIETVSLKPSATNVVYDLNGRRVYQPVRGNIYIVGGKKVRF